MFVTMYKDDDDNEAGSSPPAVTQLLFRDAQRTTRQWRYERGDGRTLHGLNIMTSPAINTEQTSDINSDKS